MAPSCAWVAHRRGGGGHWAVLLRVGNLLRFKVSCVGGTCHGMAWQAMRRLNTCMYTVKVMITLEVGQTSGPTLRRVRLYHFKTWKFVL